MFVPVFWADAQEWELDHVARVRGCTKHVSAQARPCTPAAASPLAMFWVLVAPVDLSPSWACPASRGLSTCFSGPVSLCCSYLVFLFQPSGCCLGAQAALPRHVCTPPMHLLPACPSCTGGLGPQLVCGLLPLIGLSVCTLSSRTFSKKFFFIRQTTHGL